MGKGLDASISAPVKTVIRTSTSLRTVKIRVNSCKGPGNGECSVNVILHI